MSRIYRTQVGKRKIKVNVTNKSLKYGSQGKMEDQDNAFGPQVVLFQKNYSP